MKIAITASGPDLNSQVDPRFGRAPYFIIVDPESSDFETIENSGAGGMSGVGIQSAQLIANKGAKSLLTGSCGPNAYQTLQAAGVEVIVGVSGTIKEAIEKYKKGEFQATAGPSVAPHFGAQPGMGAGRGMGMGQGMGMQQPMAGTPQAPPQMSKEEETELLKNEVQSLKEQLETITKRMEELSKK